MRTLFVSFTGLLYALDRGEISQEQLDNGLFFLGCKREHALAPGATGGEFSEVSYMGLTHDGLTRRGNDPHELHRQLVEALLKAETEGRVAWRSKAAEDRDILILQEFLNRHGVQETFWALNYPTIREALEEKMEVVY